MIDYLEILQKIIIERAAKEGLTITQNPDRLLDPIMHTAKLMHNIASEQAPYKMAMKRVEMEALQVGSYSILIAKLLDSTLAEFALRDYYTQAAIARGVLGNRDDDLYLFLIGPEGSRTDERWQRLALGIERDESICRKLIWLPSDEENLGRLQREAEMFCERTFLARPWLFEQEHMQHDLDAMNAIYEKLRIEFTQHTLLPADVLRRWLRILEKPEEHSKIAHSLFLSSRDAQ